MGFQLFPREESFFHLFEKASETLLQAGKLLVETTEDFNGLTEKARKMERLEHDADQIVHEIRARLHRTFITPIDREDIHQLASAMDDVLDFIEATTERFVLYKVSSIPLPARQLAQVIAAQVEEIHHIIAQLRNLGQQDILKRCSF